MLQLALEVIDVPCSCGSHHEAGEVANVDDESAHDLGGGPLSADLVGLEGREPLANLLGSGRERVDSGGDGDF